MPPPESGSDGENGEKPVRERLRHTKIDKHAGESAQEMDQDTVEKVVHTDVPDTADGGAFDGKTPQKSAQKRTLEDSTQVDSSPVSARVGETASDVDFHARKRTREEQTAESESKAPQPQSENGDMDRSTPPARDSIVVGTSSPGRLEATLTSPRKKRSRESMGIDDDRRHQKIPSTEEMKARRSSSEERQDRVKGTNEEENSDESKAQATAKPVFGAALQPKPIEKPKEKPQTSSSAFAASGFALLSNAASPFGALRPSDAKSAESSSESPLSSFASPSKSSAAFASPFMDGKSGFASAPSKGSVFGTTGSQPLGGGSGTFGGGASAVFGSGTRLSNFAGPAGDAKHGTNKPEKPFGAPAESDEDSEPDNEGDSEPPGEDAAAKEQKDEEALSPKFHVQEGVQTGEDNEDSVYTNRAKLFQYHADSSSWKERGVGPIKVNVARTPPIDNAESKSAKTEPKPEDSESHQVKARLIMRNHATHKILLNAPIYKEMKINEQSAKQLLFVCPNETGSMTTYMLRMGKEDDIKHLHRLVDELQAKM